ncbi:hypothetical protein [Marisediminicola sp. LYQ85]|uniref:hypothetical protein n=1 Tax=Marisediminicola sp. LYQ85 TaxID=3391062 RepID=UPI0039834574
MSDPTRMRNQPALTTSTGRIWLVMGAAFTATALAVLIPLARFDPPGVAITAAITISVVYVAMIVVRITVARRPLRLRLLAAGLLVIAAVSLVSVTVVANATR